MMIRISLALAACLFLSTALQAAPRSPRNVVYVICDGAGPQQYGFWLEYSRLSVKKTSNLERLMTEGAVGVCVTHPAVDVVTDSSAAATALAAGVKGRNETVGLDEDGDPVTTLIDDAERRQYRTGLVTNSSIVDATPAAFISHTASRRDRDRIAESILRRGDIEVLLGGGLRWWIPQGHSSDEYASYRADLTRSSSRVDDRNLLEEARALGYRVVFDRSSMESLPAGGGKLLGLFSGEAMPAEIERGHLHGPDSPSLSDMTRTALKWLDSAEGPGFFLMVEAGRIDHAGHNNDAGMLLGEMGELDRTLGHIFEYLQGHPDTLLVVTSDHETGGFGLSYHAGSRPKSVRLPSGILYKPRYNYLSSETFDLFRKQKKSFLSLIRDSAGDPDLLVQEIHRWTGYDLDRAGAMRVLRGARLNRRPHPDEFREFYPYAFLTPSTLLARQLAGQTGAVWATGTHTHTPVYALAYGPGQESFRGLMDNTELAWKLRALLGWSGPRARKH